MLFVTYRILGGEEDFEFYLMGIKREANGDGTSSSVLKGTDSGGQERGFVEEEKVGGN
jgi:hypothetical protein